MEINFISVKKEDLFILTKKGNAIFLVDDKKIVVSRVNTNKILRIGSALGVLVLLPPKENKETIYALHVPSFFQDE